MKVALIHDWLNQRGGAEDVLETLKSMYPSATVYTSLYDPKVMPAHWQDWDIRTGFIDRMPFAHRWQQLYFPLYPLNFEQFDFREYDVVISNKSGFCHGVLTGVNTLHICYCLTPTRYVWRYHQYAEQENLPQWLRVALAPSLLRLRQWDRQAADRVDEFVAISAEIRRRIGKVYRRESEIIYPPVDTKRFVASGTPEDYYLFVGRLVPYRRLDVLIEAFNRMRRPLYIVGKGRDRERLEAMSNSNIKFLGYVDDAALPDLYAKCRAFMFPGEEDFGIAPIQAMAAGRPVIAYARGGALDTVLPGMGMLFDKQTPEAIIEAVECFDTDNVNSAELRRHAEQFDVSVFRKRFHALVESRLEQHQHNKVRHRFERTLV